LCYLLHIVKVAQASFSFQARSGPSRVQILVGPRDFSLLQNIQTHSGTHLASCSVGTGVLLLWLKWPGHEVNHSPPSCAEVEDEWSYPSFPLYTFMI